MKKIVVVLGVLIVSLAFGSSLALAKTKEVVVATDSDTRPFTYKEGEVYKGYDIDLLKAIFKDSKTYELTFETVPFSSLLTGVDAGRYQIAANNFNYSKERSKKYRFSDPISRSHYAIASRASDKFDQLKDLSGRVVQVYAGSNYAQILENWNQKNKQEKPIIIDYVANTVTLNQRLQAVESAQADALLYDKLSLETVVKEQGFDLTITTLDKTVGDSKDGLEYFLFADDKEGKALQAFVNKRLKVLSKEGYLKALSETYFDGDYVSDLPTSKK